MHIVTQLTGLTEKQAEENVSLYGKNTLPGKETNTVYLLFLKQFLSPFVYILLVVAGISLLTEGFTDALIIFIILTVNALVGTFQEHRANNAIKALKKLTHRKTRVIRSSSLMEIKTEDVTVDDMVYLESGDIVPADGELVESHQLSINESQITGESIPVTKEENSSLYESTIVVSGSAFMRVKKVGANTFLGQVAKDIEKNVDKKSELEKKISHFSIRLLILLFFCVVVFISLSFSKGLHLLASLKISVALGVAVIPESLPVVLTVVLSLGALHISRSKALLRNLHSGSTLASVSYICTDKTGTLTYGDLSVKDVVLLDLELDKESSYEYIYHSLDVKTINGKKVGDILELTLEKYLQRSFTFTEIKESPFTSEKKYNVKEFLVGNEYIQIFKGAPEAVGISNDSITSFSKNGFRVIVVGYKKSDSSQEFSVENILPLAVVVFEDKIREQAKDSIIQCKKAGISVLMITGDNILTAEHVAREVGIVDSEHDILITGRQLDELNDEDLKSKVQYLKVIARANPLHKERVVRILQEKDEIVAMTGDGVNDGPALSLANIGISMGKSGTEVAKEASDLILVEDNFSDIVLAVFEARTISENIRKTLTFLMTSAVALVVAIFGSVFLSVPLPFLAIQILWLNFVTTGFLDIAVATEETELSFKKYNYKRYIGNLLNFYDIVRIMVLGVYIGVITGVTFFVLYQAVSLEVARTGVMFLISAFVWFNAINARKNYDTIFSFNPFSNIFVSVAIILEALFLLGSIYSPIGNKLLGTVAVPKELLVLFIVIALSIFIVDFGFKMTYKGFNFLSTKVKKSKIYLKIISVRSFFEGRLTYK